MAQKPMSVNCAPVFIFNKRLKTIWPFTLLYLGILELPARPLLLQQPARLHRLVILYAAAPHARLWGGEGKLDTHLDPIISFSGVHCTQLILEYKQCREQTTMGVTTFVANLFDKQAVENIFNIQRDFDTIILALV